MKKRFLLVGVIAAFGLTSFLVSCNKDKDDGGSKNDDGKKYPTCKCDLTLEDETWMIDLSDKDDMKEEGLKVGDIKSCKELASYIEDEYDLDVTCKEKK